MAKDPAFLFYPGDWMIGTMCMDHAEKGQYMTILCVMHQSGRLTESQIKNVLKTDVITDELRRKFKIDETGKWYNDRLEFESNKRKAYSESRRNSRLKSDEDNVRIYLIEDIDSGNFKIGSSVNPLRRFAEMCNQKNPAITIGDRNYRLFWISEPCLRSVEGEIHKKFKSKNITGEWFALNEDDIIYINSNYKGNFQHTIERTLPRTENENENEIVIEDDNKDKKEKSNRFAFRANLIQYGFDKQLVDDWMLVRKTKKSTNSKTAFDGFITEIEKRSCVLNEIMAIMVEKSWAGFKWEWIDNLKQSNNGRGEQVERKPIEHKKDFTGGFR